MRVVINRSSAWAIIFAMVGIVLQFVLCRPASVASGWPPINPFWIWVAPWVLLGWCGIYVFFDDRCALRRLIRIFYVPVTCCATAGVVLNTQTIRPHIGSIVGQMGIAFEEPAAYFSIAGVLTLIAFPVVVVVEHVFLLWWKSYRFFCDQVKENPSVKFSISDILWFVAIVCALVWSWCQVFR